MAETSIGLSNEVKERLEPVKEEHEAATWDEFMDDLLADNLGISPEELEEYTVEQRERVEQTRATIIGLLEALDEMDMVDEVVDIIKAVSQQDMLAQNQKIVAHLLEKAQKGDEINEADRLLANLVMKTEGSREHESPAAQIAQGLFAESDTTAAERTVTERHTKESEDLRGGEDDEGEQPTVDVCFETTDEPLTFDDLADEE